MLKKLSQIKNLFNSDQTTNIQQQVQHLQSVLEEGIKVQGQNFFLKANQQLKTIKNIVKELPLQDQKQCGQDILKLNIFDILLLNFVKIQQKIPEISQILSICDTLISISEICNNQKLLTGTIEFVQNCYVIQKSNFFLNFIIAFMKKHQDFIFQQQILEAIVQYSQINLQAQQIIFHFPKIFQQCNVEENSIVIIKTLILNAIEQMDQHINFQDLINQIQFIIQTSQKYSKNQIKTSEKIYKFTILQIFDVILQLLSEYPSTNSQISHLLYLANYLSYKIRYVDYRIFQFFIKEFLYHDSQVYRVFLKILNQIQFTRQFVDISCVNEILNYQIQCISGSYLTSQYEISQNEFQVQIQGIIDEFKFFSEKTQLPKFNGDFIAHDIQSNIIAQWSSGLQRNLSSFAQNEENENQRDADVEQQKQQNLTSDQDPLVINNDMQLSSNEQNLIGAKLPELTQKLLEYCQQALHFLKTNDYSGDDDGKLFNADELVYIFDFEQLLLECIKQIIIANPYLSQASIIVDIFQSLQFTINRQNKMYSFIKANNMSIIRSGEDKIWIKYVPNLIKKLDQTYNEIQGIVHGFLLSQIKK